MGIWIFATLAAYFVKGVIGFAYAVVFSSALTFSTDNVLITPVELLLSLPANAIMAWKERKHIDKKFCVPLIMYLLLGSIPGMLLLRRMDTRIIKIIFGVLTVVIAAQMYRSQRPGEKKPISKVYLTAIGIIAGFFCGMFGVGALLGAYLGSVTEDPKKIKANISVVFFVETVLRTILYSVLGIIHAEVLRRALMLFPFMILGMAVGMKLSSRIPDRIIRLAMILLLMFSGISLILTNLL